MMSTEQRELATTHGTGLVVDHVELMDSLLHAIVLSGFSVNPAKTRLYSKDVRQEITNLTVNEFVNVKRSFIRQIRAMIHAAKKHGLPAAGVEHVKCYSNRLGPEIFEVEGFDPERYFLCVLYGKLAFLRMVRGASDTVYVKFCLQMAEIDASPPRQIQEIKKMHEEFDVFICHASEDREAIASPLCEALKALNVVTFLDVNYIKWGDSFVEKINHALSRAKIVIVILSASSVDKAWPRKEVNAALAREVEGRTKILSLMVGADPVVEEITKKLPLLGDKSYKRWDGDAAVAAAAVKEVLAP